VNNRDCLLERACHGYDGRFSDGVSCTPLTAWRLGSIHFLKLRFQPSYYTGVVTGTRTPISKHDTELGRSRSCEMASGCSFFGFAGFSFHNLTFPAVRAIQSSFVNGTYFSPCNQNNGSLILSGSTPSARSDVLICLAVAVAAILYNSIGTCIVKELATTYDGTIRKKNGRAYFGSSLITCGASKSRSSSTWAGMAAAPTLPSWFGNLTP
jgi:hypothetical protein